MATEYHVPVLLAESIEGLNINKDGIYADLTFGGGGHSRVILENLDQGTLIGFDQDRDALNNVLDDERFIFAHHNFKYMKNFINYYGFDEIDGILADLGVSSHEFDEAERGFSFRFDSDLDMRMNQTATQTAADICNHYSEAELINIFRLYGELKNARKVASLICRTRQESPILKTLQLKDILEEIAPKLGATKFFAKVFQALRIEVNDELGVLERFLENAAKVLKPGGRLVVISYHSLEDRIVKNFIQAGNVKGKVSTDFYGNRNTPFKAINRKIILPTDEEIERNPRARSAKLRIAEKL